MANALKIQQDEMIRRMVEHTRRTAAYDGLVAALSEIRDNYGHVCPYFELCNHESCRNSYAAWHVANEALRAVDATSAGGEG